MDCISTAHPSWLTEEEIEGVGVPVQILAPEIDPVFTPELKDLCNRAVPLLGLDYDFQHFAALEHGFAVRCEGKRISYGQRMLLSIGSINTSTDDHRM